MTHIMSFSEYTSPAGAITESLTQRSAMIRFNKVFRMFRESLVKGDKDMFVSSMEGFSKFFEDLYGSKRNDDEWNYTMKAYFSMYKSYVFTKAKGGDDLPIRYFNSYTTQAWSVYDEKWDRVPEITFSFKWSDCNSNKVSVSTFINCYKNQKGQDVFFKNIENQFVKLIRTEVERTKAAGAFGEGTLKRYNMVGVTDYVGWVAKNAVAILKSNGLYDTSNFYSGISLRDAECYFWTGGLKGLNADGITYYVGGDSTDEEGIIPYSDWRSVSRYREYCSHAEVYCDIDYGKKQEFSKKIYDYILNLLKEGKLK